VNKLFDVMLSGPLPQQWIQGLLFITFSSHILFVLMTIGTALLALFYFIHALWLKSADEEKWDVTILKTFLAHKSLAVVLGLAPLLLMQVGFPVPFFNSVGIFAPYWMLIIVFLIVAFLSYDAFGHKIYVHRFLRLFLGIIALIFLLIVPGIFVLILVTAENPDKWVSIIQNGYRIDGPLALHWFLRYLHVIGAAVVFGAAFHYFFTARHDDLKKLSLSKWIMAGILFQFAEGPILALLLPHKFDVVVVLFLIAGISSAAYIIWRLFSAVIAKSLLTLRLTVPLLMITLVSMLLIRQHFQNISFIPLVQEVRQNSDKYAQVLSKYWSEAIGQYMSDFKLVYDNGGTIYAQSCSFCHGNNGNGKGSEAWNLSIPPEDIAAIRSDRQYIYSKLVEGIPGTSMPYFTIFDKDKIEGLIDYLNIQFRVLGAPEQIPVHIAESAMSQAEKIYTDICAKCHGEEGKSSAISKTFQPQPPDFTRFSLSPSRTFEVIRDGYPGTAMPPFRNVPEDIRWGLVRIVYQKRGIK
jgi:mono/diheme cytochrome c family protein